MFLLSSAATCRIGFQLGNARHRNTVGSLEKHEPEWRFWQPLSLSQSFTFPSSLLLLVSLPFLAYSASPRAKSWALVSSPLHPSPQRLCWISARSRSRSELQEGEGEEAVEEGKEERGKKERERPRETQRQGRKRRWTRRKKGRCRTHRWTWDGGLCCLYYIGPFSVGSRRIESPRLIYHLQAWSFFITRLLRFEKIALHVVSKRHRLTPTSS